jgi:hypothetical protein
VLPHVTLGKHAVAFRPGIAVIGPFPGSGERFVHQMQQPFYPVGFYRRGQESDAVGLKVRNFLFGQLPHVLSLLLQPVVDWQPDTV